MQFDMLFNISACSTNTSSAAAIVAGYVILIWLCVACIIPKTEVDV